VGHFASVFSAMFTGNEQRQYHVLSFFICRYRACHIVVSAQAFSGFIVTQQASMDTGNPCDVFISG
jgi:hypothetical protein